MPVPTLIWRARDVMQIVAYQNVSYVLTAQGRVYSCGEDAKGLLGRSTKGSGFREVDCV